MSASNVRRINQHKEALENMRGSLERYKREAEAAQNRVNALNERIAVLAAQIDRATAEGKAAFDAEKYNIPRKPKTK